MANPVTRRLNRCIWTRRWWTVDKSGAAVCENTIEQPTRIIYRPLLMKVEIRIVEIVWRRTAGKEILHHVNHVVDRYHAIIVGVAAGLRLY